MSSMALESVIETHIRSTLNDFVKYYNENVADEHEQICYECDRSSFIEPLDPIDDVYQTRDLYFGFCKSTGILIVLDRTTVLGNFDRTEYAVIEVNEKRDVWFKDETLTYTVPFLHQITSIVEFMEL